MRSDFAAKLRRGGIGRRTPGGSALVYFGPLLTARTTGRCVASAFFLDRPGNIDPAMAQNHRVPTASLVRRLGLGDAVVLGLGSMIGAGVFAAFAPAARAAGSGLLIGLAVAALVAYCNATSSARLAARYPESGGAYIYAGRRLSPFWGYLAGWSFVVGKTASCAAMALTVGAYLWPGQTHAVAVAAVVTLTAVNYTGVQKSALLTRAIVAVVLAVLCAVVVTALTSAHAD